MKVLFQSRTNLFDAAGGDTIQLLKTKEFLEKLGVKVDISLEFEPDLTDYDLVHLFNLMEPQDVYLQMRNARKQNKKIALSTIYGLYTEFEKKARGGIFQKLANVLSPYQIGYIKVLIKHFAEKRFHKGVYQLMVKGYYGLMKEMVDNTDVFLPNSVSEMNRVAKEFKLSDYHFFSIPNAIDKAIFSLEQAPVKYPEFEGCILCAARIEGRKSTLNLIKALSDTNYTLVLAGKESSNQKAYVKEVHRAAGPNVVFLGPVSHEELRDLYARARVHALVSWMETPGLSSLEAAAMGCNIVVTDKGDTRDYFGDDAFYCEPDDIPSIVAAVNAAYSAPPNTKLKQRILDNYIWEKTAEETLNAYTSVLQ
jgi:glycosyltransferase involved in cell wall biosynthesis